MSRLIRTAVTIAALSVAATTPARAIWQNSAVSTVCQLVSVTDHGRAGYQVGTLTGVVIRPDRGTLECAVFVNGVQVASRIASTAGASPANVAVTASTTAFPATFADTVTVCSIFHGWRSEWWQQGGGDPGSWQPFPVDPWRCTLLQPTVDPNPTMCPVLLALDSRLNTVLASIWQDCEPYVPII